MVVVAVVVFGAIRKEQLQGGGGGPSIAGRAWLCERNRTCTHAQHKQTHANSKASRQHLIMDCTSPHNASAFALAPPAPLTNLGETPALNPNGYTTATNTQPPRNITQQHHATSQQQSPGVQVAPHQHATSAPKLHKSRGESGDNLIMLQIS